MHRVSPHAGSGTPRAGRGRLVGRALRALRALGFAGFLLSNESSYVSAPALRAGGVVEHRGFQASKLNAGYFLAGS